MASDDTKKESLASAACWVAAARARESERADRLFDDPWAALLAGQVDQGWLDRIATIQTQAISMSTDYRISLHWGKPGQEWGYPALRFETAIRENLADAIARAIRENLAEKPTNVLAPQKKLQPSLVL